MGIEILLVLLAVVLFGGLLLGIVINYREVTRARQPEVSASSTPPQFYGPETAETSDHVVLHIEHYLRGERKQAQRFAETPCLDLLLEEEDQERVAKAN